MVSGSGVRAAGWASSQSCCLLPGTVLYVRALQCRAAVLALERTARARFYRRGDCTARTVMYCNVLAAAWGGRSRTALACRGDTFQKAKSFPLKVWGLGILVKTVHVHVHVGCT